MKVALYTFATGKAAGEVELDDRIFNIDAKPAVVHQVMVAQTSNARKPLAHTKDRSEVAGSGKKPWRQKGTGRARVGSVRSPIWRGGGITFGPRNERNYTVKVNKKMKNAALRMVLSDKARDGKLVVVDSLTLKDLKTKQLVNALKGLPVGAAKAVLALGADDQKLIPAAKNIPQVFATSANSLNIGDLLARPYLVISQSALQTVAKFYGPDRSERVKAKATR